MKNTIIKTTSYVVCLLYDQSNIPAGSSLTLRYENRVVSNDPAPFTVTSSDLISIKGEVDLD